MNSILNSGRPVRGGAGRRRFFQRAEYVLLAVGFLCVGIYVYSLVESGFWQSYDEYRLESTMRGTQPWVVGYVWHLLTGGGGAKPSNGEENAYDNLPTKLPRVYRTPPPYGIIGRIEVPRLKVSAVVREGVDSKTLRRAAGHVPGTALPGDDGNVAVAAHRDTFFRGLRDIRENDHVRMVTPDGTFDYIVRSTQIVKPTDVEVLDSREGKRELTLITCYPFNYVGRAPERFIVKAEQTGMDGNSATSQTRGDVAPAASVIPAVAARTVSSSAAPSTADKAKTKQVRKKTTKRVTSRQARQRKAAVRSARGTRDQLGW